MTIDPSSCAVRDPAADVGIAKDKPVAGSPPEIRVTEGNPAASDVPFLVDNDEMEPVEATVMLPREPGGVDGRETGGGGGREIGSGCKTEFELENIVVEGSPSEADTSLLGEMADHKLGFGVSDKKSTEASTSLMVLIADPKLELGISERNPGEAVGSLRGEFNAVLVSVDTSAPDADPFAPGEPVDSESEFCGVLDPGGGSVALINVPSEIPSSGD